MFSRRPLLNQFLERAVYQRSMSSFFQIAGYCALFYTGFRVVKFIKQVYKESLWSKTFDFKKYGSWAVITGGSDGIGKALAFELAQCHLNIVLISRTRKKLEKVRDEILEKFDVEVVILPIDVTEDDSIYDAIKNEIENMDISLLVNNVAVAHVDPPLRLLDVPEHEKYSDDAVRANIRTMLKMTEMILPNMVENKGGVIANISSVIGARESPFFAMYGATKSFVINYTKAMAGEYQSKGVVFQCIIPGMVATPPIAKTMKSNFMVPTPEKYAKYLVKALGKSVCTNTSFFWHIVFQQTFGRIPDFLFAKLMELNSRQASKNTKG